MTHQKNKIKRIMIFGKPGAGKSTFAYTLHKKKGIPLYHLDGYFFLKNWVERDYDEFLDLQQELLNKDQWIIEGCAIRSLEMRYQRADVCLYFNYPNISCLWGIMKRLIAQDSSMVGRPEGCPERFSWKLIKYMLNFEKRVENTVSFLKNKYPDVQFFEIKNNHDRNTIFEYLIS